MKTEEKENDVEIRFSPEQLKLRIPDKNDPSDVSSFLLKNIDSGSKSNKAGNIEAK